MGDNLGDTLTSPGLLLTLLVYALVVATFCGAPQLLWITGMARKRDRAGGTWFLLTAVWISVNGMCGCVWVYPLIALLSLEGVFVLGAIADGFNERFVELWAGGALFVVGIAILGVLAAYLPTIILLRTRVPGGRHRDRGRSTRRRGHGRSRRFRG